MAAFISWPIGPEVLELKEDEVHVWGADLNLSPNQLKAARGVLSAEEQKKADRFHFAKDQNHYTAARGFLRTFLGSYLCIKPEHVPFAYNSFGKPELGLSSGQRPVRFNLAHSHGLALFAFNLGREIGIDLELIRPDFATDEIAARFFAAEEVAVLKSLPKDLRPGAFFNCWTRKEAFIKARGMGLSYPLAKFVVSFAPGENPALLRSEDDPQASARWSLHNLEVSTDYAAALAVEGQGWDLKCWSLASERKE